MPNVNEYLNLSSTQEVRFEKDHNEIAPKRSGVLSFIGRLWDQITGSTSLGKIFHTMSEDLSRAPVSGFQDVEAGMQLKERVEEQQDKFSKASWVTRHFGGHGDVVKSAEEVRFQAEANLCEYWGLGHDMSVEQAHLAGEIYELLHSPNQDFYQDLELDRKIGALLGMGIDDLADFYETKCGDSANQHYHTARRYVFLGNDEKAAEHYNRAADRGHEYSQETMEAVYRQGAMKQAPNPVRAHELAGKLSEGGAPRYHIELLRDKFFGRGTERDLALVALGAKTLLENPNINETTQAELTHLRRASQILNSPETTTDADLEELEYSLRRMTPSEEAYVQLLDELGDDNNRIAAALYLRAQHSEKGPADQRDLEVEERAYYLAHSSGLPAAARRNSEAFRNGDYRFPKDNHWQAYITAERAAKAGDVRAQLLVAQDNIYKTEDQIRRPPDRALANKILFGLFESNSTPLDVRHQAAKELLVLHQETLNRVPNHQDNLNLLRDMELTDEQLDVYSLGVLYDYLPAESIEHDPTKALNAYKASGAPHAFMQAGISYQIHGSEAAARECLSMAANIGEATANVFLGYIDEHNEDFDRARILYSRAVDQGVKEAWFPSIQMLSLGVGGEQDVQRARAMLMDPARPNDPKIEYLRGQLELQNQKPNWSVAAESFLKAADAGVVSAQVMALSLLASGQLKQEQVPNAAEYQTALSSQAPQLENMVKHLSFNAPVKGFTQGEILDQLDQIMQVSAFRDVYGNVLISDRTRGALKETSGQTLEGISARDQESLAAFRAIINSLHAGTAKEQGTRMIASILFKTSNPSDDELEILDNVLSQLVTQEPEESVEEPIDWSYSAAPDDILLEDEEEPVEMQMFSRQITAPEGIQEWLDEMGPAPENIRKIADGFGGHASEGRKLLAKLDPAEGKKWIEPWATFYVENEENREYLLPIAKYLGVERKEEKTTKNLMHRLAKAYLATIR
ncbi:MAG: hypothetical protein Q8K75_10095 [Chlamydiales bacterium]|nr:hypothetical protein [Chlamydiales bacterium]